MRWLRLRKRKSVLKLLVLNYCLLRNPGKWTPMWASPGPALWGFSFSFSCWYTHCIFGSLTATLALTPRFLEGEDGEDTAKIRQADIVEAVDIASAAKVS